MYINKLTAVLIILFTFTLLLFPNQVKAAGQCSLIGVTMKTEPSPVPKNQTSVKFIFEHISDGFHYRLAFATNFPGRLAYSGVSQAKSANNRVEFTLSSTDSAAEFLRQGRYRPSLEKSPDGQNNWSAHCEGVEFVVGNNFTANDCFMKVTPPNPTDIEQFRVDVFNTPAATPQGYKLQLQTASGNLINVGDLVVEESGIGWGIFGPISPPTGLSTIYLISNAATRGINRAGEHFCKSPISIFDSGGAPPRPVPTGPPPPITIFPNNPCAAGSNDCSKGSGTTCNPDTGLTPGVGGIMTAIGCIPTEPTAFITGTLRVVSLTAGGIAFLLMIFGAIKMISSSGNPEPLKQGQEQFNSAIIGLLIILFSVFLLQILGFSILQIPGFPRIP